MCGSRCIAVLGGRIFPGGFAIDVIAKSLLGRAERETLQGTSWMP